MTENLVVPTASTRLLGGTTATVLSISLAALFEINNSDVASDNSHFRRERSPVSGGMEWVRDEFADSNAVCVFLRVLSGAVNVASFTLAGEYQLQSCPAGGWVLQDLSGALPIYWIPDAPRLRDFDADGHIKHDRGAVLTGLSLTNDELGFDFAIEPECNLDLVIWRLPSVAGEDTCGLFDLASLETQPWFVYASHTRYSRPADFYQHLVFGHVYGNVRNWPRYWKLCDELDAYGLYLIASGLERATNKSLYRLFKQQLVFSVIERQADDGGWYHGEWTDRMESHYRLVNGAILMLAAYLEVDDDDRVRTALRKAVNFLIERAQRIDAGLWFVHDSLEGNQEGMSHYPFAWSYSTALGKLPSNMLILNTHLDTTVALDRYQQVTGDHCHAAALESACGAASAVLGLRGGETLYRVLFRLLDLTLLTKDQAMRLPLPLRALKRLGWKYLAPQLHHIKARLPRLVMPNGFIDRALCQKGYSTRYQSVHVWDLVRYLRRFPDESLAALLRRSAEYSHLGPIRAHWKEAPERQDALGFWVEALYHLCLFAPDLQYRGWLAEAIMDVLDVGLGLPPSLLGCNPEAVPHAESSACPSPTDARLRVANLSLQGHAEILVVNPTSEVLALSWEHPPAIEFAWSDQDGATLRMTGAPFSIPPRGWILGVAAASLTLLQ